MTSKKADKHHHNHHNFLNMGFMGMVPGHYETVEEYAGAIQHYYETIIACMPGNVYWMDNNSVYLGCNDNVKKMFGFTSRNEIVGKTYKDFMAIVNWSQEEVDSFRRDDIEVITSGKPSLNIDEPPIRDIDGRILHFLTSRVPILDQNNKVVGILGISIEISERKRIEDNLREAKKKAEAANKAKTEFLENMRHDIRTPLSGIIGLSSLLSGETEPEKIQKFSASLAQASNELLRFLNEVLESINVASGDIPLLKKKFSLIETLENLVRLHQPIAIEKQLSLSLLIDEAVPKFLIGDPIRIYRITLELLVNALKFTEKGYVKMYVKVGKTEGQQIVIKIFIEDSGVGIPTEKQQDLYVRFKRLTPSYEGIYKGVGLGLSIVKEFLDDLKGEIYLESNLNKGTKFVCIVPLEIPLLDEDPFKDSIPSTPKFKPEAKEVSVSKRIQKNALPSDSMTRKYGLIVEDHSISALVEKTILIELGCVIDVVDNGTSAVNQAKNFRYDFIIMDIGLPDIDGCEVTRNIRAAEKTSKHRTFIIGLTGHADEEKKQTALDAGMDLVLIKPLTREISVDLLKNLLNLSNEQVKAPQ